MELKSPRLNCESMSISTSKQGTKYSFTIICLDPTEIQKSWNRKKYGKYDIKNLFQMPNK